MENIKSIKINQLPAKTWYWLGMNDTEISWEKGNACTVKADCVSDSIPDTDKFKRIETGAGIQSDSIFDETALNAVTYKSAAGSKGRTVCMDIGADGQESSVGTAYVDAEEDSDITIVERFVKGKNDGENLAFRTKLYAGKNSRIRLIQINMMEEKETLLNDIGFYCESGAQIELLQLYIGKGSVYGGIRTDLAGDGSAFNCEIGYIAQNKQKIDINLVVNHIGKKTKSLIKADGTLKDSAKKIFRGTIDLRRGSSESEGAETEDVLLLGDNIVNKTIPLILCAEENVKGSHGATIGALSDETLFYFASRGIPEKAAEIIMAKAKIEALCRHITDEGTREIALKQLTEVIGDDTE